MTPEAWQRVKAVFDAARQRPPGERASFLDSACGGDATVRAQFESLLAADETEGFLDTKPLDQLEPLLRIPLTTLARVAQDRSHV
jgi:hypothetical protein